MHCELHDKEMVRLGEKFMCLACLAGGSVAATEMIDAMRERTASQEAHRRMVAAGIPTSFTTASFNNFVATTLRAQQIAEVLQNYCANFAVQRSMRPGFLFTGIPGNGKTHLACSIVQSLAQSGYRALYSSLPRFTLELRAAYGNKADVDHLMSKLKNADFLVLDEIDLHGTSDNDYNLLYDIINARYERQGFPTLAISNRSVERLTADLDERLVSRILGGSRPIVFDWPSRRELRLSQQRISQQRISQQRVSANKGSI